MMKWKDNLLSISKTGRSGKCPCCGSEQTDYKCTIVVPEKRMGYMDVWCNECKNAHHISRMEISNTLKTKGDIPEGLKY